MQVAMQVLIRHIIIGSFFLLAFQSGAQIHFFSIFSDNGYDAGYGVVQLADSSYMVTGSSSSYAEGPNQAFLMKVDKDGNRIWSRSYGGFGNDVGQRVLNWNDTVFYMAGYSTSFGNGDYDFYLIKTDRDGNVLFERNYGTDTSWEKLNDGLFSPADSSVYMVGETTATTYQDANFYIVKTDKDGDTVWTRNFGGPGDDVAREVKQYNDTTFFIAGDTYNPDSSLTKAALIRFYADGTIDWTKEYGDSGEYHLNDFVFVGTAIKGIGTRVPASGDFDDFRLRTDIDGTNFSQESDHLAGDVIYDNICRYGNNGQVYIASYYKNEYSSGDGFDVGITRFYEDLYWNMANVSINFEFDERNSELVATNDLGAVAVGYITGDDNGGSSVYLLKIGADDDFPTVDDSHVESLVSVAEAEHIQDLEVFPNPAGEILYVRPGTNETAKVSIFGLQGQIVLQETVQGESALDISALLPGVYFLQFGENAAKLVRIVVR